MSNYITTHDSDGKAIFSNSLPTSRTKLDTLIGSMEMLYTTHKVPTNVASEKDIEQYSVDAKGGLGNRLCPESGTAAAVLNISPKSESPFHRTMTLDVFMVIEGDLELTLDSGEKRLLHQGDCVVQRVSLIPDFCQRLRLDTFLSRPSCISGRIVHRTMDGRRQSPLRNLSLSR